MGSFTTGAATQLMKALFNTLTTASATVTADGRLLSGTTIGNTSNIVIYNQASAGTAGIFACISTGHAQSTATVRHRIDLIAGANATIVPLTDLNFPTNGNTFSPNSTTNVGFATYGNYQGMSQRTDGLVDNNHSWTSWTLGAGTGTVWQAKNAQQIGFPTCVSTAQTGAIVGFCISAGGSTSLGVTAPATGLSSAATSTTQLLSGTPTAQVIFAYGDLSGARAVAVTDTPVFTADAIVITLE
jgi:hypothetical protein